MAQSKCGSCGNYFEFSAADAGMASICPNCGAAVVLSSVTKPQSGGFSPLAHKQKKTEHMGGGVLLQIVGVVLCCTLIGAVIGIPLIVIGGKMARKLKCSNCGNAVADRGVKICPVCHAQLA